MRRSELKNKLKTLHRGLEVIRYSNRERHTHGGNDAVYFYSQHIGAIPQGNIYSGRRPDYKNERNYVNRSLLGLKKLLWVKGVLRRWNDSMLREIFTR